MNRYVIIVFAFIFPNLIFAQLPGFLEDFNDNTLTGWDVYDLHKRTFNLAEEDSILKIYYTRTEESGGWDNFNYTPPQPIAVADAPVIKVKVRSNVSTVLTFKPVYSNSNTGWLQYTIPEDSTWHDVTFNLTNHGDSNLEMIYMYLDGGSSDLKSGVVHFDDLKIGDTEQKVRIKDFIAVSVDSNRINLSWTTNHPDAVDYFKIYGGDVTGFSCDGTTFIDTTSNTFFSDSNLVVDKTYYYKIIAVDTAGSESSPSNEASARTYRPGEQRLFEAEHATFTNAEMMIESSASNSIYLNLNENATVLWAFNWDSAGWFKARIGYKHPYSDCVLGFKKNGIHRDIGFGWTSSWSEHVRLVKLEEGTNTIELITGECVTHIDYLYIDTVTVTSAINPIANNVYEKSERDLTIKLNAYGRTVSNITAGATSLDFAQEEFSFEEDAWKLQIDKSSLAGLEAGSHDITINYESGESSEMKINSIEDTIPAFLTIVAPHVSHGNSVFFILPTGKTMLVDCGTSTMRDEVIIPLLHRNNITKLDYFILTHYHEDHDGGDAGETIKTMFDVDQFYDYKSFEEGDTLDLELCHMKILNAFSSGTDENTSSLSFKLEYNGFIYGHGADIYGSNQQAILLRYPDDVKAHVYSTNHNLHGSVYAQYYRKMDPCIVFNQAQEAIYARSAYTQTYLIDAVEWLKENSERYIETLTTLEVGAVVIRANSENDWTYETHISDDSLIIPYTPYNMSQYENQIDPPKYTVQPENHIYTDSSQVSVKFFTNKRATMRFGLSDVPYAEMANHFSDDSLLYHQTMIESSPDEPVQYYFRAMDMYGNEKPEAVMITVEQITAINSEKDLNRPTQFALEQNHPNPFNPSTKIEYQVPKTSKVEISIYNLLGQKVVELINTPKQAGYHKVVWNASAYPSGMYFIRMQTKEFSDVKKCLLLK